MKRIILLLIVLGSFTSVSFSQQKGKDYITMKSDGKVYWIRSGETIRMAISVPLKNGSQVTSKGSIIAKDGEVTQISKGDKVMMDGTIIRKGNK